MHHTSVLLHEVIQHLITRPSGVYVDGTLGAAGHTREIIAHLDPAAMMIGIDRDSQNIDHAAAILTPSTITVDLIHDNFRNIAKIMKQKNLTIDGVLLDLGWSTDQFDDHTRGFSFQHPDAPLDMSLGLSLTTAGEILNTWDEQTIADILFYFSDERFAKRIARNIVEHRQHEPFVFMSDLLSIVSESIPKRFWPKRIHPATKTLQALRMAVNDEIGALEEFLETILSVMNPAEPSRIAIITFHSVEDRLVKRAFHTWEKEGKGVRFMKKGLTPSEVEVENNPRARSARLRIFETLVIT